MSAVPVGALVKAVPLAAKAVPSIIGLFKGKKPKAPDTVKLATTLLTKEQPMDQLIISMLPIIIGNADLQEKAAQPLARGIADALPDVAEDSVADFLERIASHLRAANE